MNNQMKYHKNITIDNLQILQEKIIRSIPMKYDLFPGLIYIPNNKKLFLGIPELASVIESMGLTNYIRGIAVNTFRKTTSPIHLDKGLVKYSLNIPLCGYNGTYLEYFTTDKQPIEKVTSTLLDTELASTYYAYPVEDCILDETVCVDGPIVINIKAPHRFVNPFDEKRSILLIRLSDCPEVDAIVANL